MRIYLDVSCLNRPFDDQSQARIRLESEAVAESLEKCDLGVWEDISSTIAQIEIRAMPDDDRRRRVISLLPSPDRIIKVTPAITHRAVELQSLGIKPADALHVAAAEQAGVDVLLTCDDRLLNAARRNRARIRVRVANPVAWLQDLNDDANA